MSRGGRPRMREAPERRCVATGERGGKEGLIRFVLDPGGRVTPDLVGRLPGRGVWVGATRAALERAIARNLFARGLRAPAVVPADLLSQVEHGLARRAVEAIGLARKAGLAVTGFEKTRATLRAGPVAALIEARDGAEQGRAKLRPLAANAAVIDALTSGELGLAFGRDFVIHAALERGGASERAVREARRLAGVRAPGGERPEGRTSVEDRARRDLEAEDGGADRATPAKDGS